MKFLLTADHWKKKFLSLPAYAEREKTKQEPLGQINIQYSSHFAEGTH